MRYPPTLGRVWPGRAGLADPTWVSRTAVTTPTTSAPIVSITASSAETVP
ncbi:hypothetical protein [Ancylobacter terrae]